MSEWSQVSEKLMDRLVQLWDDEEFVVGTMSCAVTEEERAELLRFMETYDNVTVESVSVFALQMKQALSKER